MDRGSQSRDHSLANILWRLIWVIWTFYKILRNPAPRKMPAFLAVGLNPKWPPTPFCLEIKPEPLESGISTLFQLSLPLGLWFWYQFYAKRPFIPNNQRWPPSTSWKVELKSYHLCTINTNVIVSVVNLLLRQYLL